MPTIAAAGDEERAVALRRMKAVALGLLLAAAVLFAVARSFHGDPAWVGYVESFAEAAMVGALADWFAVTALFRHPLGLPIPHTAIVPRRKDVIGRSLGAFVEGNFLAADAVVERVAQAEVAARAGAWLADPVHAARVADGLADAVGGALGLLDDREVQGAIERLVEGKVADLEVAALAARVLEVGIEGGHHERLLDGLLRQARRFLADHRDDLKAQLARESPWWLPDAVDRRIAAKVLGGVERLVEELLADPSHELRKAAEVRLVALVERLRVDPALAAKGEELKQELLAHPDVRAWIASLWAEGKAGLLRASAEPGGELRRRLAAGVARAGGRLAGDQVLQARVEGVVERLVRHVVERYRSEVADLIESTVARWDAADTSRRLELQVGRDLQFIRINGTIVGGLAGVAIHAVSELLL